MFIKAQPIFLKDLREEKNILALFKTKAPYKGGRALLKIAGATFYRIKINGVFVHYGPAKAPHKYFRVDEIDITENLKRGENEVTIEVISYNVNSFYTVMNRGFLLAEITVNGEVISATGYDFNGYLDKRKIQKTMRYSFQRHISEVYDLREGLKPHDTEIFKLEEKLLSRGYPHPDYSIVYADNIKCTGFFKTNEEIPIKKSRYITDISPVLLGFKEEEIEKKPLYEYQKMEFEKDDLKGEYIKGGRYVLYDMGRNHTGFIFSSIHVKEEAKILISFEEYTDKNHVDSIRFTDSVLNVIEYTLPAGTHILETMEPYGFKYLQITVVEGSIKVNKLGVRQYIFPKIDVESLNTDKDLLKEIYEASIETFRQNVLDGYMDCPTRERAGWLCDSYYMAKSEFSFTGKTDVEKEFLESFVLGKDVPGIPKGMLPMCYPGDFPDGMHIPQWSLWYILQLEEYLQRNREADREYFKDLCYSLLKYFEGYRNELGLLESLPGWNFVEWSRANSWTQDVNYPTNMLFARAMEIIGEIYGDESLTGEAQDIRKRVIELSYNGTLFTDNAVRENGKLINTGNISEVCQYYAFMFKTIDFNDDKYIELKNMVLNQFGPGKTVGNIEPANALMGIYLRMELLLKEGYHRQLLKEIEKYFGQMSKLTGTLWEHNNISASLNHGFASYAGVAIREAL